MDQRDREKLEQMEALLRELKAGKQRTAAAAAAGRAPVYTAGRLTRGWRMFLLLAVILLGIIGFSSFYSGEGQHQSGAFIEQIKDLNSLATAEAYSKAVIEQEDNEIFGKKIGVDVPGTKRKILLIIPGKVMAGVDLSKVGKEDVQVNEKNKTIRISIPKAEILQDPVLETGQVKTFSIEGLFREEVDWEEGYELAEEAKKLIKKEAVKQGLLQRAEQNAVQSLEQFFQQLDYQANVTISK
ncbi:DUF4230 domain-containing protein [Bacillus xiapuensis]|uniref:DUF4230 domain-containing protein n=1 Tax=Bacillus xiapuensis TaxID=2014075 RepID=UPI000C246E44|nr:DUF4230 domain-containing protein [Bacillus xiapuensis]